MHKLIELIKNKESLIICNDSYKSAILDSLNELGFLVNAKFKNYKEVVKDLLGEYEDLTYFIAKDYKINYDYAKNINDSLMLVDKAFNNKTKFIIDIKEKYKSYYKINKSAKLMYKNVYLINYDYDNDLLNKALKQINYIEYNFEYIKNTELECYEASDQIDEVFFLANQIAKLLDNKVLPNDIIVSYNDQGYNDIIKYVFRNFKIDYEINEAFCLYDYEGTKKLIEELKNYHNLFNDDIKLALNTIINYQIYNEILNVVNNLVRYNDYTNNIIDYFIYLLKSTKKSVKYLDNVIRFNDYKDSINNLKHIFVLGLNQSKMPIIYKDTKYLSDEENEILGLLTATKLNQIEKEKIRRLINNSIISYANSDLSGKLDKSLLLGEYNLKMLKQDDIIYSYNQGLIKNCENIDSYMIFNQKNQDLYKYYYAYNDFTYNSYDNSYKGINPKLVNEKIGELKLSYTSLNNYYTCPFLYYIDNVLKIYKEDNNSILVGNIFHYVLEKCVGINPNEEEVQKLISDYLSKNNIVLNNSMNHYVNNFHKTLVTIIKGINLQLDSSDFKISGKEVFLEKQYDNGLLHGKIDKILEYEYENKKYCMVIDYKTGANTASLDNIKYGCNLQLIIYLLLLDNYEFGGMYLEKVFPDKFNNTKNSTEQQYKDYIKLDGYSNEKLLKNIDRNCQSSSYLKGIKYNNDSSLSASSCKRVLTEEQIIEIKKIANEKVNEAITRIKNADFNINPLAINGKNCEYCKYHNVCYLKPSQINNVMNDSFFKDVVE